ncbi:DUF2889 domain-containing protein [Dethiobacter alkaliphilus]|uniref:DUF2889 domain-containing protein n=1 Tax=Dethiobacter alkaliphilus TaxID=427926 RepID=UPI0022263150|nr:DUF2889 domain-containing protein [Dethiobacter alkaliphilus]MCW3491046.1 DUF2889 domain-containing protein [Dethiobacter alkaliphilus]
MKTLLKRNKTIEVIEMEQNKFLLHSHLSDEVHEIDVQMIVDTDSGEILTAEAKMSRTPYPEICQQALLQVPKLVGLNLTKGAGRQARDILGGTEGCEHLKDMVLDALRGFIPAIGARTIQELTEKYLQEGLTEEEAKPQVMADIARIGQNVVPGRCVVYNDGAQK